MIIDLDKGLKGLIVHHQPISDLQLKRLLLIFDEIYFTPPTDNLYFLEKGAICYSYYFEKDKIGLYLLDGHKVLKDNADVPEPAIQPGQLPAFFNLSYGGEGINREGAYNSIILPDILPLFNDSVNTKEEERLLDKFDYALHKQSLKILHYKDSDFYLKNSISLKIAYDNDVIDKRAATILEPLLIKKKREDVVMFVPSPPLPEMTGANIFPHVKYNSPFPKENNKAFDYDRQFSLW